MTYSSTDPARRLGRALILAGFIAGNVVTPALAGPTGGRIVAGQGGIGHSGSTSTITQGSDRLIIEWDSFDTSASESVRFNQPSSSASVLNRIVSGNATIFDGSLFANGNVVIVNGSGIHFGPNSHVDVGSLIASTADISNRNFLDNRLIFDRPGRPGASITNAGTITVRDTGLAALVAPGVENSGLIQANLGTVILAAGEAHTIDFNGDGLMSFAVTQPTSAKPKDRNGKTLDALVSNKGSIHADGGTVLVTARQASRVLDNAINMSGIARANSVGVRNGKIVLFGGNRGRVNVSGRISASGKRAGERGGNVHITGRKVAIPIARIDVTGKAGGGEVLVGGAYKGGKLADDSPVGYLQHGDLVSILTGANAGAAGNGYIPTAEGVFVGQDAVIDVSATEAGNGGRAILWADGTTIFNGTIRARGGDLSGDGGFVETSGAGRLGVGATASVDALAPNGRVGDWLLDPLSVTIAAGGLATLADIADAADTTSNLIVAPSTLNNAAANVSIVASDFITFTDAVTMVNAGVGLTATAGNLITVNAALTTNNGDITFIADDIALNSTVNAGAGNVTLAPVTAGRLLDLGTETAGSLSLTDAELDQVTAGTLIVGSTTSGSITITDRIQPGNVSSLELRTGGSVTDGTLTEQPDLLASNITIQSATGIGTALDDLDVQAGNTFFTNSTSGDVSISSSGAVRAAGASTVSSLDVFVGTAFNVETGASVNALGAITIDTGRSVNLNGNLTAGGGISGNAAIVNISGSAEIQDGIDLARPGAGINIAPGTYSGFTVNKNNITINGFGATLPVVNAASPAITIDADGVTVQDMLLQGTGMADQVGILLDGTASPNLTGISIINVDFDNLDDGIRSQGNIGDDDPTTVDVTIRGNSSMDPALFTDFLDAAIDVGDTDGDANYLIQDVIVRDGNDADMLATGGDGFRFGSIGAATIRGVAINLAGNDGIQFAGDLANATILIGGSNTADGNTITASNNGIFTRAISGGTFTVANNQLIRSLAGLSNGLEFEGLISGGAEINIVGNAEIRGHGNGVNTRNPILNSTLTFAGNARIEGENGDGIRFGESLTDTNVAISPANIVVDGALSVFASNFITGGSNGIHFQSPINGGSTDIRIVANVIGLDTARVGGDGINFSNPISDGATIDIGSTVFATGRAISVRVLQQPSTLLIGDGTYDGIGGALLVDNTGSAGNAGRLEVGIAVFVGGPGSNVFEVRTDFRGPGVDIDFSGAATFTGGATGVRLSGPGIDVLNDTFGNIAFSNQTSAFVELADGAEFLPGSPTILNATSVSFDGVLGSAMAPAQTIALEERLVHFLDDPTLGLINTGALAVQAGNSIQLAVNAAGLIGGAQTVNVASGTFGGSVEVWVDNLTLAGQGATTIIDTDAIDPFANNGDANNGFQIAAISRLSGGGDVSGVTIQGFSFDTLTTTGSNTGIELGETFAAMSTAIDSTLSNNIINDQTTGIFSNLSSGTTAIAGNTLTALGNRGINFDDAVVAGETITITDNDVASAAFALVFDLQVNNANVTISGNTLTSTSSSDAIIFDARITDSTILIGGATATEGNDISGFEDGIDIAGATGSTITISNNARIVGGTSDGVEIEASVIGNSIVRFAGNTLIQGAENGVSFREAITSSTVTLDGNTAILGTGDDGVLFGNGIGNGSVVQVAGNTMIRGNFQGITVRRNVDASTVTIAGNTTIIGDQFSGIDFRGDFVNANVTVGPATIPVNGVATDFAGNTISGGVFGILHNEAAVIRGASIVRYSGNSVTGGETGIRFESIIESADVGIFGNSSIVGQSFDGIFFSQPVENNARLTIVNNMISGGSDGIEFLSEIRDNVSVEIAENAIAGANNGILFNSAVSTTNANGIRFTGNTQITGTIGDGILFAAAVTDTSVAMTGNNAITGASNGVHISDLTGSTVNVTNSTITGGTTGFKVAAGANAGAPNALNFANATLRGTIGPGASITTQAGGSSIATNLNGGNELTGAPALALSGPNQVLVGDTLNDTAFFSVNGGNFVELSDGALFEPGQPTLIDGRMAFFDGVQAPDQSPPALIQAIEDRLIDFDDDNTLGQIFFTPGAPSTPSTPPGEAPAPEFVLTHFPFLLETGVRISNPQAPGDWIQRPDFLFDILFGDLFAMTYPLGGCEPVFDATGALVDIQCIGPAQGSNISPFVDAFMANLNPAGP